LSDPPAEWHRGQFIVSTDRSRIDQNSALALLRTTFWAAGMDLAVLSRAIANSVCFGVYHREVLLQGLRRVALLTRDAEALYAGIGFTGGPGSLNYMEHRS
jgi:hypothetical protein